MQSSSKVLSRREMLKLMGMTAGAAALASCAGAPPAAPAAPAAQAPDVEEEAAAPPAAPSGPPSDDPNQVAFGWYDEWRPPEPVTLLIWGPPGDDTDPWINAMKQSLARFGDHYPEITTNYEPVPWDQLDTKVNAAIAAKQGPDILFEADREGEYPRRAPSAIIPIDDVMPPQYHRRPQVLRSAAHWMTANSTGTHSSIDGADPLRQQGPSWPGSRSRNRKTRRQRGMNSADSASISPSWTAAQMTTGGLRLQRLRALHLERHDVPAGRARL